MIHYPCCPARHRSLVIIYQGRNIFHAGAIKGGVKAGKAVAGDVCKACMSSGKGNYLANLILYPGGAQAWAYAETLHACCSVLHAGPVGCTWHAAQLKSSARGFQGAA